MSGGLGNQMFVYAFYLQMRKRFPNVRIDISDAVHEDAHYGYEMNRVFALPKVEFCINQPLKKVLEFLFFKTIIDRKQDLTTLQVYEKKFFWPFIYYKGNYGSERYFADIKDEVRKAFTFDLSIANAKSKAMREQILADNHSVSLHVRRGDYMNPKHYKRLGCVCGVDYYNRAVAALKERVDNPHFYVFSDDLEWVKQNVPLENATYIDFNTGHDSWQDMMLMSCCHHNVVGNSTFAWWGAWLNPHTDKVVISPERWLATVPTPYINPPCFTPIPSIEVK